MVPLAKSGVATLVFVDNPFAPICERHARRVDLEADTSLSQLVDPLLRSHPGHRMTVAINGAYHLPSMGSRLVSAGDIVVVTDETQGGGDGDSLKVVLQIAAMIALNIALPGSGFLAIAGRVIGSLAVSALLNNLIPSQAGASGPAEQASPTYTFGLQGNQLAQQGEPIAVGYGFMRSYPKFAGQPYTVFDNDTNDQYYYAILEVGQGKYRIARTELDDTEITQFSDITTHVVNPGGAFTVALANVVTAPEVTGQDLDSAVRVGSFNACGPGLTANKLGFDIVLNGLGIQDGGGIGSKSVDIRFEVRKVDDFGTPLSSWSVLGDETITAATTSQVRRTFTYTLAEPIRAQVRATRTDVKDEFVGAVNSPTWAGLRAYLDQAAPLSATATYIELKAKATLQLNGLTQRKIAVFSQRKLFTWNPDSGWSGEEQETRSICWAIVDALKNTAYGKGLLDGRIDLQTFYDLDLAYSDRQDRFDYIFDSVSTVEAVVNLAAKCGRAVCMPRAGVWTLMRDQQQTLPVAMYTPRMMVVEGGGSSFSMPFMLPTDETPDAVIVEYFDNRVWDWRQILCPAPGLSEEYVTRPVIERIAGIGGATHAQREGTYIAADTWYRRSYPTWTSTLDGYLPAYGSLVLVGHDLPRWGAYGDVVDWDAASLTLSLSEAVDWTGGQHYIRLQRPDGTPHPALLCEEGPSVDTAFLQSEPDFTPIFSSASMERTKYSIGTATEAAVECRVKSLVPRGTRKIQISCVLEDNRVHTADNFLLPAGGSPTIEQDPVDPGLPFNDPDDPLIIVNIVDHPVAAVYTTGIGSVETALVATYTLADDGTLTFTTISGSTGTTSTSPSDEWFLFGAMDPSFAAAFQVRATVLISTSADGNETFTGPVGTWEDFGQTWELTSPFVSDLFSRAAVRRLLIEIREVSTSIVQGSALIDLSTNVADSGG